jgi:formate hydrogenlyase subunit 3/multisubunit Na+/H+ antiporter MnhD subunit
MFISLAQLFFSNILFFFLVSFLFLNHILDFYQSMFILQTTTNSLDLTLLTTFINFNIYHTSALGLNLLEVYYYPFIYVFILITILSIIFCLIYNKDELISFIFYVILILLSGYILFITDSLILFFFAYEMLLVPSFFILYKFAKTRRCVEAAYLMFF